MASIMGKPNQDSQAVSKRYMAESTAISHIVYDTKTQHNIEAARL
jgi:hypothetical protein